MRKRNEGREWSKSGEGFYNCNVADSAILGNKISRVQFHGFQKITGDCIFFLYSTSRPSWKWNPINQGHCGDVRSLSKAQSYSSFIKHIIYNCIFSINRILHNDHLYTYSCVFSVDSLFDFLTSYQVGVMGATVWAGRPRCLTPLSVSLTPLGGPQDGPKGSTEIWLLQRVLDLPRGRFPDKHTQNTFPGKSQEGA